MILFRNLAGNIFSVFKNGFRDIMNIYLLIEYTVSILFLWLIIYVLYKNPNAIMNRICALFLSCFFIWNFFAVFYSAAETKESAMLWSNFMSIGWSTFPVFALWMALSFTGKEKIFKKWYFYFLILIPVFFIYKQFSGYLICDNIRVYYGWLGVWTNSIWTFLYFSYYFLFVIITILLYLFYIKKAKYSYKKKQGFIIVITGIIPIILGSFTNVLIPILKVEFLPQLGNILPLIWAGGIVYAITKYGLMTLTPAYAANDILATMSDSLILIDTDGKIIEENNAALSLLGYSKKEITGSPAKMLFKDNKIQFPDEKEEFINKHQIFLHTKNGEDIPASFSISKMKDKEGNLLGFVGVGGDMREILRLQEREREFTVEKAKADALLERAQELQEAYDKLKATQAMLLQSEKMAAVGQLAGGVAHEINNPMGVILGFAQSIVKRIKEDNPLYMPLKSIEREAVRCRKMVVDLLTFSRTVKSQAESIDINQTIDETLSLIESQTKLMNIKIKREYETGLPAVTAYKNQIQQVIVNLCNNAIDAMPAGGKIIIATKRIEQKIIIEISDTGKGMSEEIKKHIFEPFFTTKESGKGTGLGLSLCYEIIKKHNGTIEVESEIDKETIFTIKLPLVEG